MCPFLAEVVVSALRSALRVIRLLSRIELVTNLNRLEMLVTNHKSQFGTVYGLRSVSFGAVLPCQKADFLTLRRC